MLTTHHRDRGAVYRPARRWHYKKQSMKAHSRGKKERRELSQTMRDIIREFDDCADRDSVSADHAAEINIHAPRKRNGSAKGMRQRHQTRRTRRMPCGHSGWTTVHGPLAEA